MGLEPDSEFNSWLLRLPNCVILGDLHNLSQY